MVMIRIRYGYVMNKLRLVGVKLELRWIQLGWGWATSESGVSGLGLTLG